MSLPTSDTVGIILAAGGGGSAALTLVVLFMRRVLASTRTAEANGSSIELMQKASQSMFANITNEVNRLSAINIALSNEVIQLKTQVGDLSSELSSMKAANELLMYELKQVDMERSETGITDEDKAMGKEIVKEITEHKEFGRRKLDAIMTKFVAKGF